MGLDPRQGRLGDLPCHDFLRPPSLQPVPPLYGWAPLFEPPGVEGHGVGGSASLPPCTPSHWKPGRESLGHSLPVSGSLSLAPGPRQASLGACRTVRNGYRAPWGFHGSAAPGPCLPSVRLAQRTQGLPLCPGVRLAPPALLRLSESVTCRPESCFTN